MSDQNQTTDLQKAVEDVREALGHLKDLERIASGGRYYFAKKAGAAFQIIEAALKEQTP